MYVWAGVNPAPAVHHTMKRHKGMHISTTSRAETDIVMAEHV